jgi:hypothetical protein
VYFYQLIRWLADRDTSLALASGRDSGRCGVEPAEKNATKMDPFARKCIFGNRKEDASFCACARGFSMPTHTPSSPVPSWRARACAGVVLALKRGRHSSQPFLLTCGRAQPAVDTCRRAAHIGNSDSAGRRCLLYLFTKLRGKFIENSSILLKM